MSAFEEPLELDRHRTTLRLSAAWTRLGALSVQVCALGFNPRDRRNLTPGNLVAEQPAGKCYPRPPTPNPKPQPPIPSSNPQSRPWPLESGGWLKRRLIRTRNSDLREPGRILGAAGIVRFLGRRRFRPPRRRKMGPDRRLPRRRGFVRRQNL